MLLLTLEVKCQVILLIFHVLVINQKLFCMLWRKKIFLISTRSACSSKTSDVSRVMQQLAFKPDEVARCALRVSISDLTKEEEIDKFIYCLKEVLDSIKKQR